MLFFYFSRLVVCSFPCTSYLLGKFNFILWASTLICSVQLLSRVQLFETPCTAACQASLSITNSWSPPKPMSIESVMPSNHLNLCHPLFLLPSVFPRIRVFSSESALHNRWPKYRSFSFSVSPSSEYSGLISFRTDWFDLLAVQDSQKSSPMPQFESISSLVLSLLYGPTLTSVHDYWKNHSFDYMAFVSKAMSLLLHWLLL